MTEVALVANNDEIKNLSNSLFSSLEEKHFFPALGAYFHKMVGADNTKIFIVNQDQSASLISENGKISKKKVILVKGEGSTGHVIRTRKPYFSNNTERDPLFSIEASAGVRKELIAPIVYEGIVIATIHFQVIKKEIEFSRDHITNIFATLNNIQKPIANMKMYLAAKGMGYKIASFISSRATVLNDGCIGENCFIFEDNTIQPFVTIGNNVTLWSGNHIGHHSTIKDHCFIASQVVVSGGVEIGEQCFIGVNATLRDNIKIGARCVVGAGALLLADTEPEGVYIGAATNRSKVPSTRLRGI